MIITTDYERDMMKRNRDMIMGVRSYDWCFGGSRTPEQHPYGYDAFYVWREFEKDAMDGIGAEYSDRLQQRDPAKHERARSLAKMGWIESTTKEQAKRYIDHYFGGEYECVGFARCCNVSNGYGLGIFYLRKVEVKT